MGTAHAQEAEEVFGPSIDDEAEVAVASNQEEDETTSDDAIEDVIEIRTVAEDVNAFPMELIALDAEFAALTGPIAIAQGPVEQALTVSALDNGIAPISSGIVTPQSVDPFYGNINPFYGNINPFYGDIDAFWGNINPFYGDIDAFWGHINPFYGHINPFYGDIDAFWGDIDAFYGNIGAFDAKHLETLGNFWKSAGAQISATENSWATLRFEKEDGQYEVDEDDYGKAKTILSNLSGLVTSAEQQFGEAYKSKTGHSIRTGLIDQILKKHGIELGNPDSLAGKSAADRAAFYLDFQDSLNQYSGVDQVDHWMAAVNWTPSVTQIQGWGYESLIGIIDSDFGGDADLTDNLVYSGGTSEKLGGHGAGVASLIFGAHDGEGVMGIAPSAKVRAYNPFGTNGTASWSDIGDAIVALKTNQTSLTDMLLTGASPTNASVINLSLGEKGWVFAPGLAKTLYRSDVDDHYHDTVFVFAAGNDGITQTTDIEFNDADETAMIFVGSINPLGEISSFSNRPGNACLTDFGKCKTNNRLMDRFIVAPGELLLVSDGYGGVTRRSGTSFAAPLVSGAVTLLHARWPWLTKYPMETTEIIFRSARDLGAPGVDEVYGHGLLDVTASQSPLDFNSLSFTMYQRNGLYWSSKSIAATELLGAGVPSWWETDDVFFSMFERVGNTKRDFVVPMSAYTYGKSTNALGRGFERLQDFVSSRFATWINSGGSDSNGDGLPGFTEVSTNGSKLPGEWSLRYDAIMPNLTQDGSWNPTHGAATLTNPKGNISFTLGHGQGSMALSGYRFGVMSDHDPFTGGVNPVLGFASGEVFAAAAYEVAPGTTVRVGYSENREEWDEVAGTAELLLIRRQLGDRPASAVTLDLEQRVSDRVWVGVQYTKLREVNALLGSQTSSTALLGNGSRTEAMTISASVDIGHGITFDLSATGGRSETANDQLFANAGKIWSTAGQVTATKRGLFSGNDTLRVSVAQPLQIEQGELEFRSEQVVDRLTGETGVVSQTFGIETRRRITGEAVYAMPVSGSSEFGLFGRYVSAGEIGEEESYVVGSNFTLRF